MMINDVPIIAGGSIEYGSGQISEVYKLDNLGNSWVLLGNMTEKRQQFAVAELNGGVWAMGGFASGYWSSLQITTEIIYTNGTILDGPDLPETRARHCAVTLPNGKVAIMGGVISSSVITKDVLIYDPSTSTYTSGPDMFYEHENFACVHFYSDKHGGRPVILGAGGISLAKAEIYDYDNGVWEQSKLFFSQLRYTGGPLLKRKSLTRFPLPRFLAYVRVTGGISVSRGPQYSPTDTNFM